MKELSKKELLEKLYEWFVKSSFGSSNEYDKQAVKQIRKLIEIADYQEETKKKISEVLKGENNSFYGKKRPEHSKRMSGSGNPWWGKKVTKEFFENWADKLYEDYAIIKPWKEFCLDLKEMIRQAGVEVKDD